MKVLSTSVAYFEDVGNLSISSYSEVLLPNTCGPFHSRCKIEVASLSSKYYCVIFFDEPRSLLPVRGPWTPCKSSTLCPLLSLPSLLPSAPPSASLEHGTYKTIGPMKDWLLYLQRLKCGPDTSMGCVSLSRSTPGMHASPRNMHVRGTPTWLKGRALWRLEQEGAVSDVDTVKHFYVKWWAIATSSMNRVIVFCFESSPLFLPNLLQHHLVEVSPLVCAPCPCGVLFSGCCGAASIHERL